MPLIDLYPGNTVERIIRDFKRETGLNLIIYDGLKPADSSMTIRDLWKKKHGKAIRWGRQHNILEISHKCLFNFDFSDWIGDVEELFMVKSQLKVKILTPDDKKIGRWVRIEEVLPKGIRKRINWRKIEELNLRLADIGNDLAAQCELMIPAIEKRIKDKSDWLKDYNLEVQIAYFLDDKDPLVDKEMRTSPVLVQRECVYEDKNGSYRTSLLGDEDANYSDWGDRNGKIYQKHNSLFHIAFDRFPKEDVQRIGDIWGEIHVEYQHFYRIKKG